MVTRNLEVLSETVLFVAVVSSIGKENKLEQCNISHRLLVSFVGFVRFSFSVGYFAHGWMNRIFRRNAIGLVDITALQVRALACEI